MSQGNLSMDIGSTNNVIDFGKFKLYLVTNSPYRTPYMQKLHDEFYSEDDAKTQVLPSTPIREDKQTDFNPETIITIHES